MIDKSHPKWRAAEKRLRREPILWLTTVRGDGRPQSSPVWFLWDDDGFLVYSMPAAKKVANIRGNPKVSAHLSDDGQGGDVVTLEGTAEITADGVKAADPAYVEKYRQMIIDLGYAIEGFAKEYSTAILIVPTRARMW